VHIGYNSKSLADNASNEIVIGANAVGNGNNTATIGDTSLETLHLNKSGAGIVLKSPDGTKYKLSVANGGTLSISAI
jgi:hypothetical protein